VNTHDLAVLGGGITGLGIARLAARNGFSVALFERADLAAGASSASSHMLHGGLRYLEHARFSLVHESLLQRAELVAMAPSLARPQRFLVPLYRSGRVGPFKLDIGLRIYDAFAAKSGFAPHAMARAKEALTLEPGLERSGLRGAGLFSDAVMDDARLAIAVARDAADHGAHIHTYTEFVGARPGPEGTVDLELRDHVDERSFDARARVVVNATGAWTDAVRTRLFRALRPGQRDPQPLLRPSRGIHLVYPALTRGHGLLLLAADGRACFAIPFAGRTLVGTTEVETDSPPAPGDWRPTLEEVRYVRRTLAQALPATKDLPPLAVYSGLRPLLRSDDRVGDASREHAVIEEHGVITIAGGKWTTFRVMARHALAAAARRLGRTGRKLVDPVEPLPAPLADGIETDPLARFAVAEEMARRVPDVVRRRTTLWLADDGGRSAATRVAAAMAGVLGWSPERTHDEFQRYDAALAEDERLLAAAGRE